MRNPISITVYWGNDDAESTISISVKQWNKILIGEDFTKSTWSYYEGLRIRVIWEFSNRTLNIYGDNGEHWVGDTDLSNIHVYNLRTDERIII